MCHFRHFFVGAALQGQEPAILQTVILSSLQQALVQIFQLLRGKISRVQIQNQHPVGYGYAHSGSGLGDLLPAQPV